MLNSEVQQIQRINQFQLYLYYLAVIYVRINRENKHLKYIIKKIMFKVRIKNGNSGKRQMLDYY